MSIDQIWQPGSRLDTVIRASGWQPGRTVDLAPWTSRCQLYGCEMGSEMTSVLMQLGGLTLAESPTRDSVSTTGNVEFIADIHPNGRKWVKEMEGVIRAPFGVAGRWNPCFLLIDTCGNYFLEYDDYFRFAGVGFVDAMERLLFGIRVLELWPSKRLPAERDQQ